MEDDMLLWFTVAAAEAGQVWMKMEFDGPRGHVSMHLPAVFPDSESRTVTLSDGTSHDLKTDVDEVAALAVGGTKQLTLQRGTLTLTHEESTGAAATSFAF